MFTSYQRERGSRESQEDRSGSGGSGRLDSLTLCMQAIPECRKRVWKKEWQRIVGSQTSFLTGTKRIANRHKQWKDGKRKGGKYICIAKKETAGWMKGGKE